MERVSGDVEKCQTKGFDWQNFTRTDKKNSISAVYFIIRTDKIVKISLSDWHVQNDFNISVFLQGIRYYQNRKNNVKAKPNRQISIKPRLS